MLDCAARTRHLRFTASTQSSIGAGMSPSPSTDTGRACSPRVCPRLREIHPTLTYRTLGRTHIASTHFRAIAMHCLI